MGQEDVSWGVSKCDPGGIRDLKQYLHSGFYPVYAPPVLFVTWRGKLPAVQWSGITNLHKTRSLRSLAKEYGVSHEAVRRILAVANRGSNDTYQGTNVGV